MSPPKASSTILLEPSSTTNSIGSSSPVSPVSTKSYFPRKAGTSFSLFARFFDSTSSQQHGQKTLFKHDRRWRWWNFIAIMIVLLIIAQAAVLCKGYKDLLNQESSAVRIGKTKTTTNYMSMT